MTNENPRSYRFRDCDLRKYNETDCKEKHLSKKVQHYNDNSIYISPKERKKLQKVIDENMIEGSTFKEQWLKLSFSHNGFEDKGSSIKTKLASRPLAKYNKKTGMILCYRHFISKRKSSKPEPVPETVCDICSKREDCPCKQYAIHTFVQSTQLNDRNIHETVKKPNEPNERINENVKKLHEEPKNETDFNQKLRKKGIEQPTKPASQNWICLWDKPRHPNPAMQEARCNVCKVKDFDRWKACQELKQEHGIGSV